ncbi:hypothetical protein AB9P05_08455 [Roseivirga sp. BDSF3-8]|uniref:hypothetical protein n=1 Tax=Roseivirga sp. BDSF3-8 TaxID=3241598 RepID=UPI003532670E
MLLNKKHTMFARVLKYLIVSLAIGLGIHQGVTEVFQYKMPLYYLLITFGSIVTVSIVYFFVRRRSLQFAKASGSKK